MRLDPGDPLSSSFPLATSSPVTDHAFRSSFRCRPCVPSSELANYIVRSVLNQLAPVAFVLIFRSSFAGRGVERSAWKREPELTSLSPSVDSPSSLPSCSRAVQPTADVGRHRVRTLSTSLTGQKARSTASGSTRTASTTSRRRS